LRKEPRESVARATATAGGAVVFAGGTVIIALLSLAAAGIPLVTTLGYTAAIVVIVAAAAATTLLPAMLGLIGLSINRLRLPGMRLHHDQRPHGWARWAAYVGSHPWPALIVGLVVLLVLAAPVRSLHLGQTDNGALPKDTQSCQSYDMMSEGFGPGSNGPMLVAVSLDKPAHNDQADFDKLRDQQQKATQQEISTLQAKAEKTIQQQAQEAQEQAKQKIQEEANQQQEQAEQKIREQADQAKQQAGPREREVIDKLAQQEIDKQNQAIEQKAQKEIKEQNASIQQQAKQKEVQEDKAIEKKVKEEAKQKEKSSGQEDKEKFLESKSSDPRLTALRTDLQKTKGVDTVTLPRVNNKGEQMGADVGGTTASYIDLASEISSKLPLVIGIVLVL
jgi:uncharacterized membrane protein YdfJ with MMPL/SSD domain